MVIVHEEHDKIVPFKMSQELSELTGIRLLPVKPDEYDFED